MVLSYHLLQAGEAGDHENELWSSADLFFLWDDTAHVTTSRSFCVFSRDTVFISQGFVTVKGDKE